MAIQLSREKDEKKIMYKNIKPFFSLRKLLDSVNGI